MTTMMANARLFMMIIDWTVDLGGFWSLLKILMELGVCVRFLNPDVVGVCGRS